MQVNNLENLSLDEVIFLGRNKAYGSYMLRRIYQKNIMRGAAIGVSLFALLLASPFISELLGKAFPKPEKLKYIPQELVAPPVFKDDFIPPPPPPPPPTPVRRAIIFVPPRVVETAENKNTPPIPPDIPVNVDISTKKSDGDPNAKYTAPVEIAPPPPHEPEEVKKKEDDDKPFVTVEQKPEFPEGELALFKYLNSNIKYPAIARENNIEGTVYLGFVVEKDGSITDVKIKRGVGGGCSEEAMRVVQLMPKWKPGKQQGRAVRVAFTIPVKFKLDN